MSDPYIKAVLAQAAQSEPGHTLVLRGGELRADRAFWESIPERNTQRGCVVRSVPHMPGVRSFTTANSASGTIG